MFQKEELMRLALLAAQEYGIKKEWVYGFIKCESNWDQYAIRYEKHWKYLFKPEYYAGLNRISVDTEIQLQSCSFGLMQVMGTVSREFDFKDSLLKLTQVDIGLKYGCLKLSSLIRKYGYSDDTISAYNQGSPARLNGIYVNQKYVEKVRGAIIGTAT